MPKVQKTCNKQSQKDNSKDSPTEWTPPSSGCTSCWTGFLMAKEFAEAHVIPNPDSSLDSETVDDDSTPPSTSSKPKFVQNFLESSLHYFCKRAKEKLNQINEHLCLALFTGCVPFSLLENKHFIEFQKHLVDAVLAIRGTTVKHFINPPNLHQTQHTSENSCTSLYDTLNLSAIKWEQIVAVVTDNQSPMIKLYRLIREDHPHVIGVPCCLHFFNLIAKDLINHLAKKQPVINALDHLKSAKTPLGDIWKELITIYCETSKVNLPTWPGYTAYKDHCLMVLNT
ncbi:hypothetical protein DFH28DRAFT_1169013 [Melampsora americana]|nr:hypothetical protein DFH28DRAFT_1169013 [Melampsora americana]